MLRARLFGSGRLLDGDAEIALPSRAWTLPLLAYLVLHRGELLSRRRLAFMMWPDEPEEAALQNLRRNLHRLVKALPAPSEGEPWIKIAGHNIAWNRSTPFECDVTEFERLRVEEATLERAVAAYSGEFLSDLHDDWIAAERERLRGLYHADLSTLVSAKRSQRAFPAAAKYARDLLASDPWHEAGVRALMAVRYDSGDAAGALEEFDVFTRRLHAEMNVMPMPETVALRAAIARGVSVSEAHEAVKTNARAKPVLSPFVGRHQELSALHDRWLRAAKGSGGIAFIRGEGGIGKSRLASQLALNAEAEGGRVLLGTTSLPERGPYQSLATALRDMLPLVAAIPLARPLLAAVADIVPELRSYVPGIPPALRLDAEGERDRLCDAFAQLLTALGRPRPVLLILEDLHRAGTATIEALAGILPRLSRASILVVVTYRPEGAGRTHPLRKLLRATEECAENVELGPFGENEVRALVEAIDPGDGAPDPLPSLLEASGGNPLFVTELIRDARRVDAKTFVMPASISVMITERVASLAAASRTVADIAAVAGESFTTNVVREVAGLPNADLLDGLDELLDRHLVRESTERGRYQYAFTHHLVRAAIYEAIPTEARARRHRRIARILDAAATESGAEEGDERSGEIALHYERGGDSKNAAIHYASAAKRAAYLNANVEARDLIDRALALDSGSDRLRFNLLSERSRMNVRLSDCEAERRTIEELEPLALRLDDDAVGAVLELRIDLAYRIGDLDAEIAAINRLAGHASATGIPRWAAVAAWSRSRRAHKNGDYGEMLECALSARDHYEVAGNEPWRATCLSAAALASSCMPGRASGADELAAEALLLADRVCDAGQHAWLLRYVAAAAEEQDDDVRFFERARQALELCSDLGTRALESQCRRDLGVALAKGWYIDDCLTEIRESMVMAESCGEVYTLDPYAAYAALLMRLGDFKNAIEWSHRCWEASLATHRPVCAVIANDVAASAEWKSGNIEGLRALVGEVAFAVPDLADSRYSATIAVNRGRLFRCERNFGESVRELERAISILVRTSRGIDTVDALDDLALTHLGSGSLGDARAALERGTELMRPRSTPALGPALHEWISACVYRASGEHHAAREAIGRANEVYLARLARIGDPTFRETFEAIPAHRALRAAHKHDEWPAPDSPCVVAFPGARVGP